jgi:cation transport regulator ChaC
MTESKVWVFFYGSYMNLDVLKNVNLVPEQWEVARVSGYDILIQPRANLIRSDQHCVYGILATATHAELNRLYAHAQDVLGETYLPEAVLAETLSGMWRAALCYIAPSMEARPAEKDYVERIVKAAKEFNFPEWYIERLESFWS